VKRVIPLDPRRRERAWVAERHRVLGDHQRGFQLRLVEDTTGPPDRRCVGDRGGRAA
jgi:hypothetical protein